MEESGEAPRPEERAVAEDEADASAQADGKAADANPMSMPAVTEPSPAAAQDELLPAAAEVLDKLNPRDREVVLAELRGRTPEEQEVVLAQVSELLVSVDDAGDAGEPAADGNDGAMDHSPAGSDRVPTEEELHELWAQVFDVVTDEDRATIEKALEGRSLAERYEIFLEVEQQLAAAEDGDDHDGGGAGSSSDGAVGPRPRRRSLPGDEDDERAVDALPFDELRERWAAAFDRLCEPDQKVLLRSIDEQDAVGQTRLLLAVEERIAHPNFEPGASILDGEDDEDEGEYDEGDDDPTAPGGAGQAAQMAEVHLAISRMEASELESEFSACFEMLLERTEPSDEADEDAKRLQAEWDAAELEAKRELLFQVVFLLNNPEGDGDGGDGGGDGGGGAGGRARGERHFSEDEDEGDDAEARLDGLSAGEHAHKPQKLGESMGVHRRGAAGKSWASGGSGEADARTAGGRAGKRGGAGGAARRSGSAWMLRVLLLATLALLGSLFAYSRLLPRAGASDGLPTVTWREEGAAMPAEGGL